jgi:hypothetical protein
MILSLWTWFMRPELPLYKAETTLWYILLQAVIILCPWLAVPYKSLGCGIFRNIAGKNISEMPWLAWTTINNIRWIIRNRNSGFSQYVSTLAIVHCMQMVQYCGKTVTGSIIFWKKVSSTYNRTKLCAGINSQGDYRGWALVYQQLDLWRGTSGHGLHTDGEKLGV